ncbi:MAG: tetratricopeptide repeat protein, partial [Gemmataceae bacterium]
QQHFLALRINGEEEQNLCRLLRVTAYPTLIIANSEGKIHATLTGYQSPEQLREQLRLSLATTQAEAVLTRKAAEKQSTPRSRAMLQLAQEYHQAKQYGMAMAVYENIISGHGRSAEAEDASQALSKLRTDPVVLKGVMDEHTERAAASMVMLAEAYTARGQIREAESTLEQALRVAPRGAAARTASAQLTALQRR